MTVIEQPWWKKTPAPAGPLCRTWDIRMNNGMVFVPCIHGSCIAIDYQRRARRPGWEEEQRRRDQREAGWTEAQIEQSASLRAHTQRRHVEWAAANHLTTTDPNTAEVSTTTGSPPRPVCVNTLPSRFYPPQMKVGEWVRANGLVSIVMRDYGERVRVFTELECAAVNCPVFDRNHGFHFSELLVPRKMVEPVTAREVADALSEYDENAAPFVSEAFIAYTKFLTQRGKD